MTDKIEYPGPPVDGIGHVGKRVRDSRGVTWECFTPGAPGVWDHTTEAQVAEKEKEAKAALPKKPVKKAAKKAVKKSAKKAAPPRGVGMKTTYSRKT
jgi:hypothetical protein